MNTSQLPYILEIAARGSLSAAARALGLTQPALTRYLAKLEHQVGMPMFRREKRRLIPTEAGAMYIQYAREILSLEAATHRTIALLGTDTVQELRIGVSPHMGAGILGDIYPAFNRSYPNIRIVLREGYAKALLEQVRRGEISLCMTSGSPGDDLEMQLMELEEIGLAVPAFQAGEPQQGSTLAELPYTTLQQHRDSVFIMPNEESALASAVRPLFEAADFQPQVAFMTPNISVQRHMISAGAGIGLVPLRPYLPHPGLALYRLPNAGYLRSGFFYRKGYVMTQAERCLYFVWLRHRMDCQTELYWSDFNRAVIAEFAPELLPRLPGKD